ncbi:hypothetical protein [[Limnothrix rosea] IAM M-220]|uniref:hypothetical protein n=1 Tax=[Limnothrix rosea] IAM M-220 TaxID=454133 RepID=UPI00095A98E3|nr:hypothetical protein [[Limnothrix rosea] IAM M-220]OKH17277.1 hypothetical protein NIES208_10005 [[Limnothrix rosea] IAM M-220]
MDKQTNASQNSLNPPTASEKELGLHEEKHQPWSSNYPDSVSELERDAIGAELLSSELLPDHVTDEELSTNMTTFNAIETRYQNLLKDRLLQETENNPPRFPWETGNEAYFIEEQQAEQALQDSLWQPQLAAFENPFNLPQSTLKALIQSCSEAMRSLNPQGIKLVQAVESLFDVDPMMLHKMANWIVTTPQPSRSDATAVLEGNYETANEQQQIVMSMLAAQKIMENLVISLSSESPFKSAKFETTVGAIAVEAQYITASDLTLGKTIRVLVRVPQGGHVTWESAQGSASASRMYPGDLCLTLVDCQENGIYPITITLNQANQEPLTVAIALQSV